MIEIELNGAPHAVPPQQTLAALVDTLGLAGPAQALGGNPQGVARPRWPQVALNSNDKVDIVRAIGGG